MKVLVIFFALLISLISCKKDDNPISPETPKIIGLDFRIVGIDELDNTIYPDDFKVYLYQNNKIIDSNFVQKDGFLRFDSVSNNNDFKIKINNDGFNSFDTSLFINYKGSNISGGRPKDYYDILTLQNIMIFKPLEYPIISNHNVRFFLDTVEYNESLDKPITYSLQFTIDLNKNRKNMGICYSISKSNNFSENECIIFNEFIYNYSENNKFVIDKNINNKLKSILKPNEKLYVKVCPLKNGVIREKESKELGEPVYFEAVAP